MKGGPSIQVLLDIALGENAELALRRRCKSVEDTSIFI